MANIIDIGSNSVRLLCGNKKTVITTRLAENMTDGVLDEKSMQRTAEAIKSLFELSDGDCVAFATEAVRKASNKAEFLDKVRSLTGLTIDVISGEEEAEISYVGATLGYSGSATVIDLGGASCEIVFGKDGKLTYKRSFPFGCVTMTNLYGTDFDGISRHVCDIMSDLPALSADKYLAVGGTATALAAMAQNLAVYDPNKVDGYTLTAKAINALISGVTDGKAYPTLALERRKTIAQGATALAAVLTKLNVDAVTVSDKDNLEGYAIKRGICSF